MDTGFSGAPSDGHHILVGSGFPDHRSADETDVRERNMSLDV